MSTSFLGLSDSTALAIVRGTATAIGALGAIMGARAVVNPSWYAQNFGFPHGTVTAGSHRNPFIPITGGRSIAYSLALLGCVYLREDRAMSILLLSAVVGATIDGVSLIKYTEFEDYGKAGKVGEEARKRRKLAWQAAWQHWALIPVVAAIGLWGFFNPQK